MDDLTRAPYLHLTNAKELWETLITTKTGTDSLQMTRYETAKNSLHNFHMKIMQVILSGLYLVI